MSSPVFSYLVVVTCLFACLGAGHQATSAAIDDSQIQDCFPKAKPASNPSRKARRFTVFISLTSSLAMPLSPMITPVFRRFSGNAYPPLLIGMTPQGVLRRCHWSLSTMSRCFFNGLGEQALLISLHSPVSSISARQSSSGAARRVQSTATPLRQFDGVS